MQGAITLVFTAFSPLMHKADEYAEDANTKGIEKKLIMQECLYYLFLTL